MKKYTIQVRSAYEEFWRYNVSVICGGFDASGDKIDFVSAQSFVAPVGTPLQAPPKGMDGPRELKVSTQPCESITAYVYVVPVVLPKARDVADYPPFDLRIKISCDKQVIYNEVRKICQWSGDSIELKFPTEAPVR